jgi:hypothetical protein
MLPIPGVLCRRRPFPAHPPSMSAAHNTGGRNLPGQLRRSAGRARRPMAGLVDGQCHRRGRTVLVGASEIPAHPPSKCVRRLRLIRPAGVVAGAGCPIRWLLHGRDERPGQATVAAVACWLAQARFPPTRPVAGKPAPKPAFYGRRPSAPGPPSALSKDCTYPGIIGMG